MTTTNSNNKSWKGTHRITGVSILIYSNNPVFTITEMYKEGMLYTQEIKQSIETIPYEAEILGLIENTFQ